MKVYASDNIRNVGILGHSGSGKSNMLESLEFTANLISRISSPTEQFKMSNTTTLSAVEYQNMKYNLLDIPGYSDFYGELESGLAAIAGAIVTIDATTDLSVGTEIALELTEERKIPKFIFINKIDSDKADYVKILNQLREKYGKKIAPFHIPWGKGDDFKGHINVVDLFARKYNGKECETVKMPEEFEGEVQSVREMLLESVAETEEVLMDKYFAGEEFTTEEIHRGLRKGVLDGTLIPVVCGSTYKNIGLHTTFDMMREYLPTPKDNKKNIDIAEFVGQVFKTVIDPFVGKISYVKVLSGEIKADSEIYNVNKREYEKVNKIYTLVHGEMVELQKATMGDIVLLTKLNFAQNSDTLAKNEKIEAIEEIKFPKEQMLVAIEAKNKSDEDKISTALHKIREEDSSLYWRRVVETGQTVLGVQGEIHASSVIAKLKERYGVEVVTEELQVPYKETIIGTSDVQGKHKKQSGGHGQYGDVKIRFSHSEKEFEFEEEIVGGVVPKGYIPAVEKGLLESMKEGVLAKYPVTNIKAVLYDGSYHDVDSSEMAFKLAANLAFKKGMLEAKPVLLEPVMELKIVVPEENVGDIMGDITKKRGRVLGMQAVGKDKQEISAEAPMAETFKYSNDLKSMTQGRGYFEMNLVRYEQVPHDISKKIIEKAEK
ncbi:elongation factor G [Streptobacillus felis]|uniref:Elongation factor G n=1 Tax=Streptobacillus felis TaxID=1384509 RepID=A0A7Z0PEW2_9FUSO|nr:elongation factor G [Streptobacillus felis]NYV27956.1 elongation factor G [Streptobacillus felis]